MADESRSVTGDPAPSDVGNRKTSYSSISWFVIILFTLIYFTGGFILFMWLLWLVGHPEVRIETLSLSNFNVSSNYLISGGDWHAQFIVRNPSSRASVYYDEIDASVLYKSDLISNTTVPLSGWELRTRRPLERHLLLIEDLDSIDMIISPIHQISFAMVHKMEQTGLCGRGTSSGVLVGVSKKKINTR